MYARDLACPHRGYGHFFSRHIPSDVVGKCERRPARGVKLVAVVFLDYVRGVAACLGEFGGYEFHGGGQHVHADGEVRRPDERGPAFAEICEHLVLDVVPACGSDHYGLEVLGEGPVVLPEGFRHREVYAHAFCGEGAVVRGYVLTPAGVGDASGLYALLNHMAHLAISADQNLNH